jgi:hypothetical protein
VSAEVFAGLIGDSLGMLYDMAMMTGRIVPKSHNQSNVPEPPRHMN